MSQMSTDAVRLGSLALNERAKWVRRAQLLAGLGVGWHVVEAGVAVIAGFLAGSIALVGFGADSVVEALAGLIVLWRFAAVRVSSEEAERRAQQLIAVSFLLIAAYVGVEAVRNLLGGNIPHASWLGIGLAAVTTVTMPLLARAKARVGDRLGSSATKSEGQQNMLCAYLSVALLVGLGANALLGWWWADPLTALAIAGVAVKEGWETWRGDSCCETDGMLLAQQHIHSVGEDDGCDDDCCR
jgi:divalent metal cation (Fe/Co/Zn/Cd) transporter